MSAESEIFDNESGEIVPAHTTSIAPTMTKAKAQKCVDNIRKAVGSLRENIVLLREGKGWEPLGFDNWYDMTFALFGLSQRQSRHLLETATVERETLPLLNPPAAHLLTRLPDDAVQALKHITADHRAHILEHMDTDSIPDVREVLERIEDAGMLTAKQVAQLDKLRAADSDLHVEDFGADAQRKLESIEKAYVSLNNEEYWGALKYDSFEDMIRNELSFFAAIFNPVVERGGEWGDEDDTEALEVFDDVPL
jgi:L-lactate utilization protein LutC